MRKKKELIERRDALTADLSARLAAMEVQQTIITAEQKADYERLEAERKQLSEEIEREEWRERQTLAAGSISGTTVTDNAGKKPWASFGEFLSAVAAASSPTGAFPGSGRTDPRLYELASGASEGVGADGGHLVTAQWSSELYKKATAGAQIAPLCSRIDLGPNVDRFAAPFVDETSRAAGSRWGGVRIYRAAEAGTATATKPKFGRFELRAEKLMGIAYATDELLSDATSLESYFSQAFSEEFAFKLDDEILNGTGVGECLGITKATCTVSVAKETGQSAATVLYENVNNMWSRCYAPSRRRAVWLINQDVEPQLDAMTLGVGAAGVPVYLPPGGVSDAPYARLKGRPVIPVEQCATLGSLGDILLVDPTQYLLVAKGGLTADASMHVRFLYDEMTFRWTYRINGAPGPQWKSKLTPATGSSNTLSPFVALAARA